MKPWLASGLEPRSWELGIVSRDFPVGKFLGCVVCVCVCVRRIGGVWKCLFVWFCWRWKICSYVSEENQIVVAFRNNTLKQ